MSRKSVIAQTLVIIAKAYGCTIVDDVEIANRVVCLYANDAMSLMKQVEATIEYSIVASISEAVTTQVVIKDLNNSEIDSYIKTREPLDKAGAFGIQGKGALLIKEIHGDYSNIVGLPIFSLSESLKKFNINLL